MSLDTFTKLVNDHTIEFVDFRFTDTLGTLHHITFDISAVNKSALTDGIMFDGSSIKGWKQIHESDMRLVPDLSTAMVDPFTSHPTLNLICDVFCPETNNHYYKDPRSIAKKTLEYLKTSKIADTAYFGPEAEFFLFDDVTFKCGQYHSFFDLNSSENPDKCAAHIEGGNMGHRPRMKGGYFPTQPVDHYHDIRSEMTRVMKSMGITTEKHHHEVAPAQQELGFAFDTMLKAADKLQYLKYIVKNIAAAYGKTATFMPKPVGQDNGSGMHCHQSLWQGKKPLFRGDKYANLSDTALYYIGGILKHARALNAFTNPTTNSYKRLIPGFEAPIVRAYSAKNRSAACRIPSVSNLDTSRVEVRFPDPSANPYLAFSAMVMAGFDGIKNKIHPGDPKDENLYNLTRDELKKLPHLSTSLRESLEALESNQAFLLAGDVFSKDMLQAYINLKMSEVEQLETSPHPVEFDLYYSV